MLEIKSILAYILSSVQKKDPRITIIDYEHIVDNKTGIKIHMYEDWFKVTHEDETIITYLNFTEEERDLVLDIKEAITPPKMFKEIQENRVPIQLARRKKLSDLFERPTALVDTTPVAEAGAVAYRG